LNIGQHDELGEQMDIEVDVEELKYNAGEMRKKYQALKTTLRKVQKSKNGRANPALFEQREQTLNDFKSKVLVVQQSLKELALGVERSIEKINEANNAAFEIVRKEFSKQFATVIPNKRADLRRVNPEGPLEEGVHFVISDLNSEEWREGRSASG
jgi:chromosome segregation ATPase